MDVETPGLGGGGSILTDEPRKPTMTITPPAGVTVSWKPNPQTTNPMDSES